jgi:NAD(P)-dependent dehydrogenase (short-subunit alcohol dehydrogenase family)
VRATQKKPQAERETLLQQSPFSLAGKTAFVTGAATGLGAAISAALARSGADVAISDKPGNSLDKTAASAREVGRRTLCLELDVRNLRQIIQAVEAVHSEFGRIDILVNNAGINRPSPGLEVTEENWDDHFATNVKGGFFLAQAAAKKMFENSHGRIIFIASQSGLVGIPGQPVYCASKGAVVQLVRALGVEWARRGVTVNAVAPTFVETNLTRQRLRNPEFRTFVLGKIPCGELATPEQVAAAVVYLASDEAAMVNCDVLRVDGGWTAW